MMSNLVMIVVDNLEKVGIGAWRSVKIEGYDFDWKLIGQSLVKFAVLGLGISLLSIVVSILPVYMTYVGIGIEDETVAVLDSIVIITAFVVACAKYIKDAYGKLKEILGA